MSNQFGNALSYAELNEYLVAKGVENVVSHLIGSSYKRNGARLLMSSFQGGTEGGSFVINLEGTTSPDAGLKTIFLKLLVERIQVI